MTGKVVNLSRARKARARDEKRRKGDENAARFGRSKSVRAAEEAEAQKAARHLDQHRLESGREDDGE